MSKPTISHGKALYEALTGDEELMNLITGVHDLLAPEGTGYPYVVLGTASTNLIRSFDSDHYDHTTVIHIFSQRRGKQQVLEIYERVKLLLHRVALTLGIDGGSQISGKVRLVDILTEADHRTMHGIVMYEAILNG